MPTWLEQKMTDAGIANLSGTAYLVGGQGPDQKPTTTLRRRGSFARLAATASTAAEPEALSSAPT